MLLNIINGLNRHLPELFAALILQLVLFQIDNVHLNC